MSESALTSAEVCIAAGATYRQLDHWERQGYVRAHREPSSRVRKAYGSGVARSFSAPEAEVIARMVRLIGAGIEPAAAARVARGGQLAPGIYVQVRTGRPVGLGWPESA